MKEKKEIIEIYERLLTGQEHKLFEKFGGI